MGVALNACATHFGVRDHLGEFVFGEGDATKRIKITNHGDVLGVNQGGKHPNRASQVASNHPPAKPGAFEM